MEGDNDFYYNKGTKSHWFCADWGKEEAQGLFGFLTIVSARNMAFETHVALKCHRISFMPLCCLNKDNRDAATALWTWVSSAIF